MSTPNARTVEDRLDAVEVALGALLLPTDPEGAALLWRRAHAPAGPHREALDVRLAEARDRVIAETLGGVR